MPDDLKNSLSNSAWAFRGFNVENLGRTPELLKVPSYAPILSRYLTAASEACSEVVSRKVDLLTRVRNAEETTLATYDEAISLIVAVEQAQIALLRECYDIDLADAKFVFGYSLGEISAAIATGVVEMADALAVPLAMAADAVELAKEVTLGVLFSRSKAIDEADIQRLCIRVNQEGKGVIGVSTYLSPNSLLLLGQQQTLTRFLELARQELPERVYLRRNDHQWPPLHTSIVWQKNIPSRVGHLMHTMAGGNVEPKPPILSLVTGEFSYTDYNARDLLTRWSDHPQRLWDAVTETLASGVQTIVHVGPAPNIIPATFRRLAENVEVQTEGKLHMHALKTIIQRPWLATILPASAMLLRAPTLKQVILEDWLLEQAQVAPPTD